MGKEGEWTKEGKVEGKKRGGERIVGERRARWKGRKRVEKGLWRKGGIGGKERWGRG